MNNTMSESRITIREFNTDVDVNFRDNDELPTNLIRGGNTYAGIGDRSDHVLISSNVDDMGYSNVQVSASDGVTNLDAIEAAIEDLIVIRDHLRKIEAAA